MVGSPIARVPFQVRKINQSIKKMRMNPLTCFTIKITLNVQYDIKKRMLYLQLIAIVLKTQAGERICMVLPEIND